MNATINESLLKFLADAGAIYLHWWLLLAAIALIVIDAFFPTDWPARLGYFLAAAALFFLIPLPPIGSLIAAVLIWIGLELCHRFCWGEILREETLVRNTTPPDA